MCVCRETQTAMSNPTPNFQIIADNEAGLLFKNKRARPQPRSTAQA